MPFFASLPKTPELVRFFHRPSQQLYGVHGEDAHILSREYFKSQRALKSWLSSSLCSSSSSPSPKKKLRADETDIQKTSHDINCDYVTFREKSDIEGVLRFLLFERRQHIEIWEIIDNQWTIVRRGSPGNLERIEELLPTSEEIKESAIAMAIWLCSGEKGNELIGVSFVNSILRTIHVCQFEDNLQLLNLEVMLMEVGVKECLYSSSGVHSTTKLESVLERCGVTSTKRKQSEFREENIAQDLSRLLDSTDEMLAEIEFKYAMKATACIISYLELLSDDTGFGHWKLLRHHLSRYMRLDSTVVEALNLFPRRGEVGTNRNNSLYGVLNQCHTPMGSRRLMQWIRQPLLSLEDIEARQTLVELFVSSSGLRDSLRSKYLEFHIPDLDKLTKRVISRKATLEDTYRLYLLLRKVPNMLSLFEQQQQKALKSDAISLLMKRFIEPLETLLNHSKGFVEMCDTTLDLNAAESINEFKIRAEFDENLRDLDQMMQKLQKQIQGDCLETITDDLGLKDGVVTIERNRKFGFFAEMTVKNARDCRLDARSEYMKVDSVRKTGIRFRNKTLEILNERYMKAFRMYETIQAKLVEDVMDVMRSYVTVIEEASNLIAELDIFTSLAHVSSRNNYVKPVILPPGKIISLKDSRHPCLETQDQFVFVTNDVEMEKETSRFLIITGPNMGGKSTYIRQVGMIVLMSQIGCFVPCSSASISLVDCILARVGANDSQLRGVSTFMVEMLEMATILKSASRSSLVIIDELGRGTSTYDGFGLAKAISEALCEIGSFCLFATHFHELTEMDKQFPFVMNLHVEAEISNDELLLLHRVLSGPATQSYGIHIAQLAKFPQSVVEAARKKVVELEHHQQKSVSDISICAPLTMDSDINLEKMESFLHEFSLLPLDKLSPTQGLDSFRKLCAYYRV